MSQVQPTDGLQWAAAMRRVTVVGATTAPLCWAEVPADSCCEKKV